MIEIKNFVFNTFQVNTYVLFDESRKCIIIDAACSGKEEQQEIISLLEKNQLTLVRNLNTHCHIDHILGNGFIEQQFGIRPEYHKASLPFFPAARELAVNFGYTLDHIPEPAGFLSEDEDVTFGKSRLKVLYTPGHAEGSVCFYNEEAGFVITGDVLFKDTIGRTDLPTGDFNQLMKSIHDKLFTLPDDTIAYPGHGPATTIGYEKMNNPFIR